MEENTGTSVRQKGLGWQQEMNFIWIIQFALCQPHLLRSHQGHEVEFYRGIRVVAGIHVNHPSTYHSSQT